MTLTDEGIALRDPATVPVTFVTDTDAAVSCLEEMGTATKLTLDTETVARFPDGRLRDLDADGPGPLRVISMAARFADGSEQAYVFDCATVDVHDPRIVALIGPMQVCAWNADFDEKVLLRDGLRLAFWWDLMLADATLNQGAFGFTWYNNLAFVAKRFLGIDVEGKGDVQLSYTESDPLDDDQVTYAAIDAVVTLWLADVYLDLLGRHRLTEASLLECGARPFRHAMEYVGVPFDYQAWQAEVVDAAHGKIADAETRLADLTGGGQGDLFSTNVKPTWNPGSDQQVKAKLNEFYAERVKAHLGRLLEKSDSVDKNTLKLIGGELADTLLEFRDHQKLVSTYGENWAENVGDDGRVHARYKQGLVSTGRLASDKPNMQNTDPKMKAYFRPPNRPTRRCLDQAAKRDANRLWNLARGQRVIIQADLGQAELRFLAQVSGDPALREAFRNGEDMHVVTASRMFQMDVAALKSDDLSVALAAADGHLGDIEGLAEDAVRDKLAKLFKTMRGRGKTMNFAVVYGLGPAALAMTLSIAGIPTTDAEAKDLLQKYLDAFPAVDRWLQARDQTVAKIRSDAESGAIPFDFEATLRLHRLWAQVKPARAKLKNKLGRSATALEVAAEITPRSQVERELETRLGHAPSTEELDAEMGRRAELVSWALGHQAPKVLLTNGDAFSFESRTESGRRRLFQIGSDNWLGAICEIVCRSNKPFSAGIRDRFGRDNNVALSQPNGKALSRDAIRKVFEDRKLRLDFAEYALAAMRAARMQGADVRLARAAVADQVGSLGNAYRNAPIQGGVADAVLLAYAKMWDRLLTFRDAVPVMSVHDSIMVECYVEDALEVADMMVEVMCEGLAYYCPDVPAVADVEICASVSADDEIPRDELVEFVAGLAAAA